VHDLGRRIGARVGSLAPETGDGALYAASALFAILTVALSHISLYRVWGEIAVGPYAAAAAVSVGLAVVFGRMSPAVASDGLAFPSPDVVAHRRRAARAVVLVCVLAGATVVPLVVEVASRGGGQATTHVQPEVVVIEQAARRLAHGQDPYHATVRHGRVVSAVPGEPSYESFFPYLPLMAVFGLPSSTEHPIKLTDARVFFSLVTLVIVGAALLVCRAPGERKMRVLQVMVALPTAALPLATGGDDMPIVAFLLLGMVLAQRRHPLAGGLVLGAVSAMKFTAWPLAALALFAARDPSGRRAPLKMVAGMLLVAGPVVVPFIAGNPRAFFDNAILFPLGLAGISSPAASALPGHILVTLIPALHRVVPIAVAVIGGTVLVRYLVRHRPSTAYEVCAIGGWVMLVVILCAPATRVGYLLYPIDFFAWALLFRGLDPVPDGQVVGQRLELERSTA
jgi:hypothetical protein